MEILCEVKAATTSRAMDIDECETAAQKYAAARQRFGSRF